MPTPKQIRAAQKMAENVRNPKPKTTGKILKEAGYSESTTKKPKRVTASKSWPELMDKYLPDSELAEVHGKLLHSHRIEHMVFPTATKDKDIKTLLKSVNCEVRRIQHGDQATHVWFWSPDATAQKNAVELAYKIKGRITNKFEGKLSGDLNVALVEFIGDDDEPEQPEEPKPSEPVIPPEAEEVKTDAPDQASQSPNP